MRVLIQGITGREGLRAAEFMLRSGTEIVAGVTPGKGEQEVAGVPVFNSVAEAVRAVGSVDATSIYVPAKAVLPAALEAIASGIKLIHILAEGMPMRDKVALYAHAEREGVSLLGPGSLGVLWVGVARLGMIGGPDPNASYHPGNVSIMSRSGGMVNEIAHYLSLKGLRFRTMIHLGEEIVPGSTLVRELAKLLDDPETERILIFDEVTGPPASFCALAEYATSKGLQKPVMMTLAGLAEHIMPAGVPFGHAEVLLKKAGEEIVDLRTMLRDAGIEMVTSYEQFV
jgi:succinyl-CoA synthetase alpha subunit